MRNIYFPHTNGFSLDMGAQGEELELEPVKLEEVESTYLGQFPVYDGIILSAITSTSAKLQRTMSAFMRSLDKALAGTGIKPGQKAEFYDDGGQSVEQVGALISKPRKAGLFAVITAQIPCSDGQSISIIFYAPDEDPLKIAQDDTLVAFRFLLNKRDITHKVAPNKGKDISLAQTTQALSNLLEKNSATFRANLAKAMASRKELADKQDELEELQDKLTQTLMAISETEKVNDVLGTRKLQLQEEKAEVEKRFTGLKAKIEDFKPVVPEPSSLDKSIEAIKGNIERVILPELNQAIDSANQKGERAKLPNDIKEYLRTYYLSFVMEDAKHADNEQVLQLKFAAESIFADTAIFELENGGWIAVQSSASEPVDGLVKEYKDRIVAIAKELYLDHKQQGIGNKAPLREGLSDQMRDILGDMHKRAGREKVDANDFGKDLYEAFMSTTAEEAYNHLRNSWAAEEPAITELAGQEPVVNDLPEELMRHLEALEKIAAGGFVVEEAVEQINEVSDYFEKQGHWDEYTDKYNEAAQMIADAIEARLEISTDVK